MAEAGRKIAIVTGAGTGVGRAASLALMNSGFTVVLAGRRMEMLQETQRLGGNAAKSLCVSADMTDPGSIAALFAKVTETYGRLDVLFNNAGMGAPPVNFEDLSTGAVAGRREHQSHRAIPVHPARLPHHEGPEPARRPHHQQRLDLGARAAAVLRALYLDQARHHRPDQGKQSRRPPVRHRGRADRHRQCRNPDDRPDGGRRAAARRPQGAGAADGRQGGRRCRGLHGQPAARRQRAVHDGHGQQDAVRGTG